jgi:branched-chain amino acid transport system ATP-binding protein
VTALLEVRDVAKHFGGVVAVDGASLDVTAGSITGLIGPNGAGKTTLFNIVSGFRRPDRGEVRFDGERIDGRPPHEVARAGLVRTFQQAKALTRMTVLDNMLLAGPGQPGERLWRLAVTPRAARRREREIEERARELLALIRLERLSSDYAGTLSGGQRKLLEFGRALMVEPRMVMLDEPMAGVNPTLGLELLEQVEHLRASRGTTFLLIEHDLDVVMTRCDVVHVMSNGAVIASGSPEEIRANSDVVDAYLGKHGAVAPATGAPLPEGAR